MYRANNVHYELSRGWVRMDISYKGQWGYHPSIVSLAETLEPATEETVLRLEFRTFLDAFMRVPG